MKKKSKPLCGTSTSNRRRYKESGETPIVVGLLKGSVPFMAELIKRFEFPCEIDFMSVSSYDGTESIGDVRILKVYGSIL